MCVCILRVASWPPYATRTFGFLVAGCVSLALAQSGGGDATAGKPSPGQTSGEHSAQRKEFRRFQISYLTVFLITMLADWLQGTNMYTLYSGYDMPVGLLFLTGFISSAVFGTISAYGRLSSRLSIFLD